METQRKLIVQIPCLNEEATLPAVLAELPRELPGFSSVEWLIIDDGSTDRTVEVALALGVDHVVQLVTNRGLATAFNEGVRAALALGADVIVNTDGDNQYPGARIADLVAPIVARKADIVIGNRNPTEGAHYSALKKVLHRFGSWVVRKASRTAVGDPVSGFRAFSREAALKLNIISPFSYTTEMVIQAGQRGMQIAEIDVEANPPTRKSRLFRSVRHFVSRSMLTIVRTYATYKPMRVFTTLGSIPIIVGLLPLVRFLYFWGHGNGDGMVQSLIIGGTLLTCGVLGLMVGILADLIARQRQLQELTLEAVRRLELELASRSDLRIHVPNLLVSRTPEGRSLEGLGEP